VFDDVIPGTLLIDPADVRRRVTERTRAVIPVHYAGAPADLDALSDAACGRPVLEDAAHAVGTRYRGVEVGAGPNAAVFSFHPIKNLTTGEGGMVTTRDDALAARMRLLRFHGVDKDSAARNAGIGSPRYEVVEPGWKYNMLDLQAALGIEQLRKLERFNRERAALAARYDAAFADLLQVRPLETPAYDHHHAWHLYIVRLDLAALTIGRDEFIAELRKLGVGAGLHFTAVHLHRWYREKYGFRAGDLPVTEDACERILSLPLYPLLGTERQDRVIDAVRRVVREHRHDL
jgi:UDP-4-amino-4-deoxy-L-arabinose-oxoglutarate aminotransferase